MSQDRIWYWESAMLIRNKGKRETTKEIKLPYQKDIKTLRKNENYE